MKVLSKAGIRGGWAVLALVVAIQSCTAESEGPQSGQQPSTTTRAPSTVMTSPPPAAPALENSFTTAQAASVVTTASSAPISSPSNTDGALDQAPAVSTETSLAAPTPSTAGPDEEQATARPSVMDRPPASYLEETIPPCTPIEGSEEEPCRSGFPLNSIGQGRGFHNTEVISVTLNSSGEIDIQDVSLVHADYFYESTELNPTISQIVRGESRVVSYPQLVIRGTTRPHTTRCEKYPWRIVEAKWLNYKCFVDVRVNEYIIGKGPPDLTIAVYGESIGVEPRENWELLPNEWLDDRFNYPALRTAEAFEGREMIILLTIPYISSVETLQIEGI